MQRSVFFLTALLACYGNGHLNCSNFRDLMNVIGECQSSPFNLFHEDTWTGAEILEIVNSTCRYREPGGPLLTCLERVLSVCPESERATVFDSIRASSAAFCNVDGALPWIQQALGDFWCEKSCMKEIIDLATDCASDLVRDVPDPSEETFHNFLTFMNRLYSSVYRCLVGQTMAVSSQNPCSCSVEDRALTFMIWLWKDDHVFLVSLSAQEF